MATPEEIVKTVRDQGWDRENRTKLIQLLMKEEGESTDGVSVEETKNRELNEVQQRLEKENKENEELVQEIQNLKAMATPEEIVKTVRDQGWDREEIIELIHSLMKEVGHGVSVEAHGVSVEPHSVSVEKTKNRELNEVQQPLEKENKENEELVQEIQNLKDMERDEGTTETLNGDPKKCRTKEQTEDSTPVEETNHPQPEEVQQQPDKAMEDKKEFVPGKQNLKDLEVRERTPPTLDHDGQECSTNRHTEGEICTTVCVNNIGEKDIQVQKLEDENKKLRAKIKTLEKEKDENKNTLAIEKLKAEMNEKESEGLKVKLKEERKTFRQSLQQKGDVCEMDCVISVVTFICREKLENVHLCCRHLEKIIVHYAGQEVKRDEDQIKYLGCAVAFDLLERCKIVDKELNESCETEMSNELIDKVWEILSTTNAKVMILARKFQGTPGHAIVCDVENKTEDNRLTFYDPQREELGTGSKEAFKEYVKDDRGIILYTIDLEHLKKIIDDNRDMTKEKCCRSGANGDWKATATDMFPVSPSGEENGNDVSPEV